MMSNDRYLVDFDTEKLEKEIFDVVVIGGGATGLYAALSIDKKFNVCILTKKGIGEINKFSSVNVKKIDTNVCKTLFEDTMLQGAGLCEKNSVNSFTDDLIKNIENLEKAGVQFEKSEELTYSDFSEIDGKPSRIFRQQLLQEVEKRSNICFYEESEVIELLTDNGKVCGLLTLDKNTGKLGVVYCAAVICASGGYGGIFKNTSGSEKSSGDAAAFAMRAGAELMDMEFVHFYPTVLYINGTTGVLVPEKIRLNGGVLKNINGECFMQKYHDLGNCAPRDIASAAIFTEMEQTGSDFVYLDLTFKDKRYIKGKYAELYEGCLKYGIDITAQMIPVAPAEHFCIGGIKTNINGESTVDGFYACGEAACNGLHGANGLAYNALFEGLVFANRAAEHINKCVEPSNVKLPHIISKTEGTEEAAATAVELSIELLRTTMSNYVGPVRDRETLYKALTTVMNIRNEFAGKKVRTSREILLKNELILAQAIIMSAIERCESRGSHKRADFPRVNEQKMRRHTVKKMY